MAFISVTPNPEGAWRVRGQATVHRGYPLQIADGERDGIYASWDFADGCCTVETDRYGFYPLFYTTDGPAGPLKGTPHATLTLGTDIAELLDAGAGNDLDFDALSVFIRVGFFIGDDTPFRSIRAVPPRPAIDVSRRSYAVTGNPPRVRRHDLSRAAAEDAFIDLFRQAMRRRRPDGAFHLPLSGGRDSRHIFLELLDQDVRAASCVTVEHFPPRSNHDAAVAAALCARARVPHVVIAQGNSRFEVEREKNRRTHYCTDEHGQFVALAEYLARSTTTTYDGIAGDVLSQSSYLTDSAIAAFAESPHAAARFVLDGYGTMVSDRALGRVLSPHIVKEIPRERAVQRLADVIAPHLDAPNPIASFFFWNRTRREIALSPFALMRDLQVHAPFLDRDLFDLLMGLPAAIVLDRTLHDRVIARAYPGYADVPYETRVKHRRSVRGGRAAAAAVLQAAARARSMLRLSAVVPPAAAAVVTGRTDSLWYTALTFYLSQLGEVARARAR